MDTEHLAYVSYYSVFCKKIPELDMHLNNTMVVLTHFTTLHISPSKASPTFLPMAVMCNLEAPILTEAAETMPLIPEKHYDHYQRLGMAPLCHRVDKD